MTDDQKKTGQELPATWSADHSGGVPATSDQSKKDKPQSDKDEGIRPQDLTTENDQGAS